MGNILRSHCCRSGGHHQHKGVSFSCARGAWGDEAEKPPAHLIVECQKFHIGVRALSTLGTEAEDAQARPMNLLSQLRRNGWCGRVRMSSIALSERSRPVSQRPQALCKGAMCIDVSQVTYAAVCQDVNARSKRAATSTVYSALPPCSRLGHDGMHLFVHT